MIALIVIAIIVIAGGAIWYGWWTAKKRREEFAAAAAEFGWQWVAEDNGWTRRFDGQPFDQGDNRKARNVLTGLHDGRPMVAFDYSFETHSTDSDGNRTTTTHHYSIVGLRTATAFPALRVSPEGIFSRTLGKMLGNDIAFEWEEFNRAFVVKCDDPRFASNVMHQQMMEFLMQHRDTAWSMRRDWVLLTSSGMHSVPDVRRRLDMLDGVVDRVPDFVWQEYGVTDPGAGNRQA